jgi:hypothetical protein
MSNYYPSVRRVRIHSGVRAAESDHARKSGISPKNLGGSLGFAVHGGLSRHDESVNFGLLSVAAPNLWPLCWRHLVYQFLRALLCRQHLVVMTIAASEG